MAGVRLTLVIVHPVQLICCSTSNAHSNTQGRQGGRQAGIHGMLFLIRKPFDR